MSNSNVPEKLRYFQNQDMSKLLFAREYPNTPAPLINADSYLKDLNLNSTNIYPIERQLWEYNWVNETPNYPGIRNIDQETSLLTPPNTKAYGKGGDVLSGNQIELNRLKLYSNVLVRNYQDPKHVVMPFVWGGFSTR